MKLYELPSIIQMLGHCPECGAKAHHFTSLPASKPWVGLTPEQRASIAEANNMLVDDDLFNDIEAKLREKNEHR